MASVAMVNELDARIDGMLGIPTSDGSRRTDKSHPSQRTLRVGHPENAVLRELLSVAEELRHVARPEFRARLKAELGTPTLSAKSARTRVGHPAACSLRMGGGEGEQRNTHLGKLGQGGPPGGSRLIYLQKPNP